MSISATLTAALSRLPDLVAVQVPEPSNLALFSLGVLGVLLGRHAARKPKTKEQSAAED